MRKERARTWVERLFRNDAQAMLLVVTLLVIIGTINIFSATFVGAGESGSSLIALFGKHLMILAVCVFAGVLMYRFDYRRLQNQNLQILLAFIIITLLGGVFALGEVVNGARRWIQMGPISLQPSELAKLAGIIWTATMLVKKPWKSIRLPQHIGVWEGRFYYVGKAVQYLLSILFVPLVFAGITMMQPDMGTAVLILAFPFFLIMISGIDRKVICGVLALSVLMGLVLIWVAPYRLERVTSWWDPWPYANGSGFQTVQSLLAVGSGGFLGQGFAHGTSKYFYLPEAHTDFAFAVWAQELGFLGALIVVLLVMAFTLYGIRIAMHARDYFGALLATGITLLISGQALFNMLMVCGVLPVTGVPLPFISYGGSSMMLNLMAIGILANIAKRSTLGIKPVGTVERMPSLREETQSRFKVKEL